MEQERLQRLFGQIADEAEFAVEILERFEDDEGRFRKLYLSGKLPEGRPVKVLALTGFPPADGTDWMSGSNGMSGAMNDRENDGGIRAAMDDRGKDGGIRAAMDDREKDGGIRAAMDNRGKDGGNRAAYPTVLHIHGGSQTASWDHVRHWTRQGYACCSYDWSGPIRDRAFYSDLSAMPMRDPKDEDDPEASVMLTRVLLAGRMLGWLRSLPEVDEEKVGAYGISWGGSILWALNHYDQRLKAAVSVYGCGGMYRDGTHARYHRISQTPEAILGWRRSMDGIELASKQHAPMLMLAATNDFWGWMDTVGENLVRLPSDRRSVSYAANQDHHLDEWAPATLDAWMRTHLRPNGVSWPQTPQVRVHVKDGELLAAADDGEAGESAPERENPVRVRYCWSWGDYSEVLPPGRYWYVREADVGEEISVPVVEPDRVGYMYADFIFADGKKISSLPLRFSPQYLGMRDGTDHPRTVLADFSKGNRDGWHCSYKRTEPIAKEFEYAWTERNKGTESEEDAWMLSLEEPGTPFALMTCKPVDTNWAAPEVCRGLGLGFFAACPGVWTTTLTYRAGQAGQRQWTAETTVGRGRHRLELARDGFADERGRALPGWHLVQRIDVHFQPADPTSAQGTSAGLGKVEWLI